MNPKTPKPARNEIRLNRMLNGILFSEFTIHLIHARFGVYLALIIDHFRDLFTWSKTEQFGPLKTPVRGP